VHRIAVVIPCYRVRAHVLDVIRRIGPSVSLIVVVDDACPDQSGALVESQIKDPRVRLVRHDENAGVGGAVITGYKIARDWGASIIVKLDGDGQMDPALIDIFAAPILAGRADYTKGNRFYNIRDVGEMPVVRVLGNAILSFMTKFSSGYWQVFDPTNGYTALSARLVDELPVESIRKRYFFESDMLFWLGTLKAVVVDIPMSAVYRDEVSNMRIVRIMPEFIRGHLSNSLKRIMYNYFVRDFSVASVELVIGIVSVIFGVSFGVSQWILGAVADRPATTGTVMVAALPIIIGVQLLLSFLNFDIASIPRTAIHPLLPELGPQDLEDVPAAIQAGAAE
jgi:glycosyltransferase involved in cell wall biosynthesis